MGIIWRYAMPFLTTLAALVLIVHTAEEDIQAEYRYDLRPRTLDTRTSSYDQTWRAMEAEPIMQPAQNDNWDNKSLDELPQRRRPGRKRKRRPQTVSVEDIGPQERYPYLDEPPRPYHDVTYHTKTTEIPRRRKKPAERPIRWTDDSVDDIPLRRRGQRRKRPLLEPWPELSEFSDFRPDDTLHKAIEKMPAQLQNGDEYDDNEKYHLAKLKNGRQLTNKKVSNHEHIENEHEDTLDNRDESHYKSDDRTEDKSLSEFSAEVMHSGQRQKVDDDEIAQEIYKEKSFGVLNENAQENGRTNSLSLKEILKRSNGTSLSEILQQHNLSLVDLLHGKDNAVSIFKSQTTHEIQSGNSLNKIASNLTETTSMKSETIDKDSEEKELLNSETKYAAEPITTTIKEYPTTTEEIQEVTMKEELYTTTTAKPMENNVPKIVSKRRYLPGLRKKLRLRPMLNSTFKAQLSRNLITLNSRKYLHHRRNTTKLREWKEFVPTLSKYNTSDENTIILEVETTTIENVPDETTINVEFETNTNAQPDPQANQENKLDDINMDIIEVTTTEVVVPTKIIEITKNLTDRPSVVSMPRPTAISSALRRQAFNNRLKRKRMKNKNSTTEPPQDDIIKHLFGMGNLVSSSEFIARTQGPKNVDDNNQEHTTLEDIITTESTSKSESGMRHTKTTPIKTSTTPMPTNYITTEENAKIEIEEILNDTQSSAKLSRILMERNMTLNELVEHRERGSSHVHLADIFHNASREPNPPEPFLSKSLIEPISKETYPLRALLDANIHDPTAKATTIDPSMIQISNNNIPVVMDFRNNVNENAENMGIISLFNNFTKHINNSPIKKDSDGTPYETSIIALNTTHTHPNNTRESRILTEDIMDDVVSWNEIFSLMRKTQKNVTGGIDHTEVATQTPYKMISLDEDIDGDGLIVLEDLQHLKDFESHIGSASDEKLEARTYEKTEVPLLEPGILERIPSQTKSVTIATASIAGLAMVLFLLTYALFKWREQRLNIRKKSSFCDDRIQTPVFENRIGHKNNSSMRSISPMLQTSNIYTLNTLDSRAGKESPDYMWDSLRKPFQ